MIDPGILRTLAARAGEETGECYPAAGRWLLRFVELVEEYLREHAPGVAVPDEIQAALAFYARRENWQRDTIRHVDRRAGWRQAPAILDRGSTARMAMLGMPPNDEAHRRDAAGGPSGGADCSAS